jgi:hypothetical protein
MREREKSRFSRRVWVIGVAALAALLALGVASPAVAKKKKKKKTTPVVSVKAAVPFSSASTASTSANCTGKTHVSGGGWIVSPHYDPAGNTGLRSLNSASTALGTTGWSATQDAFAGPSASGSLTAVAQCESNRLSQIATAIAGSATVPSGTLSNLVLNCPTGTHVVSAGYSGSGLAAYNNNFNNLRILVLQSRRTALNQWTISAFENNLVPASGNISVSALCERDAKGRSIGESSTSSGFGNLSRASGDPTCPSKQHVVSGGYALSPTASDLPVVGIDEFEPTSKTTWHLGLHSIGPQPAGSAVTTYAYCAKDTVKKKKRRSSRR